MASNKQGRHSITNFNPPWDEEYSQEQISEDKWTHTLINSNLLDLQTSIQETIQHLDSMLWDLKGAIKQGDMDSALDYISNAQTNLDDAYSLISGIDLDSCLDDIRQLQQQRLLETLSQ